MVQAITVLIDNRIDDLRARRLQAWGAIRMFLANEDAHGVMDLCIEVQALDRAIKELEAL